MKRQLVLEKVITHTEEHLTLQTRYDKSCPVYFTMFNRFIIVTGDYGCWTFDTTWTPFKDNKLDVYNSSMGYLLGKVSRENNRYVWDSEQAATYIKEWFENESKELKKLCKRKGSSITFKEIKENVDEWFIDDNTTFYNKTTLASSMDELSDLIDYHVDGYGDFNYNYRCGEKFHPWLVMIYDMLSQLGGLWEDYKKENNI